MAITSLQQSSTASSPIEVIGRPVTFTPPIVSSTQTPGTGSEEDPIEIVTRPVTTALLGSEIAPSSSSSYSAPIAVSSAMMPTAQASKIQKSAAKKVDGWMIVILAITFVAVVLMVQE